MADPTPPPGFCAYPCDYVPPIPTPTPTPTFTPTPTPTPSPTPVVITWRIITDSRDPITDDASQPFTYNPSPTPTPTPSPTPTLTPTPTPIPGCPETWVDGPVMDLVYNTTYDIASFQSAIAYANGAPSNLATITLWIDDVAVAEYTASGKNNTAGDDTYLQWDRQNITAWENFRFYKLGFQRPFPGGTTFKFTHSTRGIQFFYKGTTRVLQGYTIGKANTVTYNVNLRDEYNRLTGDTSNLPKCAIFTVAGNIGSTSTSTAALDTGYWPAGSKIKLVLPATSGGTANSPANGIIAGAGGDGAAYSNNTAQNGLQGGLAINLNHDITILNNGTIGGGGGGGVSLRGQTAGNTHGIAAVVAARVAKNSIFGGGGGAGINPGNGGAATQPGSNGLFFVSGQGGSYGSRRGAPGGNLGNQGTGSSTNTGGAAGKAINLNGHTVTWQTKGTVYGATS